MTVRIDESLEGIDWAQAKADLTADDFDNGRSPGALRASFERSQHVVLARDGDRVVVRQLMARVPGQHIGLQTDDAEAFYTSLGYQQQPVFMSAIAGKWLVNEANEA